MIPTSGPFSLQTIKNELGISGNLVLPDHIRGLAGISSGPITMEQLRGKYVKQTINIPKADNYSSIDASKVYTSFYNNTGSAVKIVTGAASPYIKCQSKLDVYVKFYKPTSFGNSAGTDYAAYVEIFRQAIGSSSWVSVKKQTYTVVSDGKFSDGRGYPSEVYDNGTYTLSFSETLTSGKEYRYKIVSRSGYLSPMENGYRPGIILFSTCTVKN